MCSELEIGKEPRDPTPGPSTLPRDVEELQGRTVAISSNSGEFPSMHQAWLPEASTAGLRDLEWDMTLGKTGYLASS